MRYEEVINHGKRLIGVPESEEATLSSLIMSMHCTRRADERVELLSAMTPVLVAYIEAIRGSSESSAKDHD